MDLIRLPAFPSVPATGPASLVTSVLRGYSLHGLMFQRGGGAFTAAMISGIRIRQGGKDVVNALPGTELAEMNAYDGITDATNFNTLFFGDPTARTIRGQHFGDLDLDVYREELEIEVSIAGATTPTLDVLAIVGPPKLAMGVGFDGLAAASFRSLVRTVIQPSAAVTRQNYGIAAGSRAGALLRRAWFFHAALTSVEFTKNSIRKWDDISATRNNAYQNLFARTPQAGLYVLDRVADGNLGEAEPTVDANGQPWNFQFNLTTSGSDTITAFADILTDRAKL